MKIKRVVFAMLIVLPLMATASCGKDSLTTGDRLAWKSFCTSALDVDLAWRICESNLDQMETAIESGWSKECAIQWYKDKVRSRNPDPYRCE